MKNDLTGRYLRMSCKETVFKSYVNFSSELKHMSYTYLVVNFNIRFSAGTDTLFRDND